MTTVHHDTWTPAVCGSFYLHPSNEIATSESSSKDTQIKLNVRWEEIDQKFVITCDHFASKLYSTSLGIDAIKSNHELLVSAQPELDLLLPRFFDSNDLSTFNYDHFPSFLSTNSAVTQAQCKKLEQYFAHVINSIGAKPILLLLFDDDPLAEFNDNLQEIKGRGFLNQLSDYMQQLNQLSELRSSACVEDLLSYHLLEDELMININLILFEIFNFKLAPFLELKECAGQKAQQVEEKLKTLQIKNQYNSLLEEQQLNGELNELKSEIQLWQDSIFQLNEQFYRQTTELIFGQLTRMYKESELLANFNSGIKSSASVDSFLNIKNNHEHRLLRLEIYYLQEKLKCLNVNKLTKLIERHRLKSTFDVLSVTNGKSNQVNLERLQVKVKNAEIKLIDTRLSILNEEESLLKKQINYLQQSEERNESIDFDLLACFSLDDGNFDSNTFERQFDQCIDQVVLHLDFFKGKLRSLARKRAVFRTKRKLYVEEKKSNLSKGICLNSNSTVDIATDSVDASGSICLASNSKSDQLKKSRAKALERLKTFRRKQQSLKCLMHLDTDSPSKLVNQEKSRNNNSCQKSNGLPSIASIKESNSELNCLFDSDFSSFSSNCSQMPTTINSEQDNNNKHTSNNKSHWLSRHQEERKFGDGNDFTFQTHSGDSVLNTALDHGLDGTLDNVIDSDLLNSSYSTLEASKQPQPFLSLGAHPVADEASLVPSSTLLTCKAMNFKTSKRSPCSIVLSSSSSNNSNHFKTESNQVDCQTQFKNDLLSLSPSSPSTTSTTHSSDSSRKSTESIGRNVVDSYSSSSSSKTRNGLMSASVPSSNRSAFGLSNVRSSMRSNVPKLQSDNTKLDPLEEFQRIRNTLRKSVRKSSANEPTKTTRDSLEPARKELTEIFQKIRNIKIN